MAKAPTPNRKRPEAKIGVRARAYCCYGPGMSVSCDGARVVGGVERPIVPFYSDVAEATCAICGGEHLASSCPFLGQIACPACLGSGSVLRVLGSASVVASCSVCGGRGRSVEAA